jgi:hypothetical protein
VFEVEHAEVFKDIAPDLLVVSRPHFREAVCRFIVEFLALGFKRVPEILVVLVVEKDGMEESVHSCCVSCSKTKIDDGDPFSPV